MSSTEVVNFYDVMKQWNSRAETWLVPNIVYIGRENQAQHLKASPFANPFHIKREKGETEASARRRVIEQYRDYIQRRPDLMAQLPKLRGKKLVCWCKPQACHGDVLIELLGEVEAEAAPEYLATQVGMDGSQQPVLAWDGGGAGVQIGQDRHGNLYRTGVKHSGAVIGLPGKVYTDWNEWRRDFFRLAFQVKSKAVCSGMSQADYARFRYQTALKARDGLTDEISRIEREVLKELLHELGGS